MIPLAFQPFESSPFPCFFLGTEGILYRNSVALQAGLPLSDEPSMLALLRTAALQMAASGESVTIRPLLADALKMRNMTLMLLEDGLLAVTSVENDLPISVFSSQLRDPLSNIFATLPMINNYMLEDGYHLTQDIQANCYQLLRLAANLEDADLVEHKNYHLQPIDLCAFVASLCGSVASVSSGRQVPLEWAIPDHPLIVAADPKLLSAALLNTLRNSLAYTRDGNQLSIRLTQTEKNALLTIEDKGLGIKEAHLPHIFEPYFSIDPYGDTKVRPGLGLGLSVAREAITAFGGTLNMESRFGEGTRLFISLPLDKSEAEILSSEPIDYLLNKYSTLFIQLCGYCHLPGL